MTSICPHDGCNHDFAKVSESYWTEFLLQHFKCPVCGGMVCIEVEYDWDGPSGMWMEKSDKIEPTIEYTEES